MTELNGQYIILNEAFLREKANRDDPRRHFYAAMLAEPHTFSRYLAEVGSKEVTVDGYKTGPISGRMEILYARRRGWIADA